MIYFGTQPRSLAPTTVSYTVRELDLHSSDDHADQAATVARVDGDVLLRLTPTAAAVLARVLWRTAARAQHGLEDFAIEDFDADLWDDIGIDLETAQDVIAPPSLGLVGVPLIGRTVDQ